MRNARARWIAEDAMVLFRLAATDEDVVATIEELTQAIEIYARRAARHEAYVSPPYWEN